MKKLLIIGATASVAFVRGLTRELEQLGKVEVVFAEERANPHYPEERRFTTLAPREPMPTFYQSPRKSKGEKKREASARRRKGWA
jgi:hypothetical protein